MIDEFENGEREIRLVAIAARARGDFEAERLALDRLMQFDDGLTAQIRLPDGHHRPAPSSTRCTTFDT